MIKNLYITATETQSGKSAVILGMMQLLLTSVRKVAFFRPIISEPPHPGTRDRDINLILSHFGLDIAYEDAYAYTLSEARGLFNEGNREIFLDNVLKKYKALESVYDYVLCEGTDFTGSDAAFEFDLNVDIALTLSAPMVVVANGRLKGAHEIEASTQAVLDILEDKGIEVISCIINRSSVTEQEEQRIIKNLSQKHNGQNRPAVFIMPEEPVLGRPTMGDVKKGINAHVLYGHNHLNALVQNYVIAAMQPGNFLEHITPGCVVVTPGDRSDIVLAALGSRYSTSYPEISGIILTGGLDMPAGMHRLIEGWKSVPVPILAVPDATYATIQAVTYLSTGIEAGDTRKINTAIGHFEAYVDLKEMRQRLVCLKLSKITPKMFEYNLLERAASRRMRIVLPEGAEERILRATDILLRRNVADIILIGDPNEIETKKGILGLDFQTTIIQPDRHADFERYAETYHELRKAKGMPIEQARDIMGDPTYFSTMMVYKGDADGMVSGSINTTAHTIRPAFEIIKTKPDAAIVSSIFLMCLKDRVLAFGDCAVNPNPTAAQLADIAVNSAHTAGLFGIEPRVAMLSYSTGDSGKGEDVDRVIEATRIAKERAPHLFLEGPLQYDAAIDPAVARTKLPDSPVAGRATVFIFPDLNTGNNTYKAVQRAADDVIAIGPVLQGLNKPVNDLSRGCTVIDIVNTVAITAVQAQAQRDAASESSHP